MIQSQVLRRRAVPIGLRVVTMVSRFGLIFLLARFLAPESVGLYGLLVATVTYATFAVGLDFYTYANREILRADRTLWRGFASSTASLFAVMYVAVIPLSLVIFGADLLPMSLLAWFVVLVPTEHLGLELDRVLVAMSDQLGASLVLFMRQALLPIVVTPAMALWPALRNLEFLFAVWVAFNVIAIAVGTAIIRRRTLGTPTGPVDWAWIRRGLRVAGPFLVGTLCLRLLFTADRQVVASLGSLEELGAYTLFASLGAAMTNLLAVSVFQFSYPRLVQAAHKGQWEDFRAGLRTMTIQTVGLSALAIGGILVVAPHLIEWIGRDVYEDYAWALPWIMFALALYNLSLVPHYGLYALDADRTILVTAVAAVGIFALALVLAPMESATGRVVVALASASAVLLAGKTGALVRARPGTSEQTGRRHTS